MLDYYEWCAHIPLYFSLVATDSAVQRKDTVEELPHLHSKSASQAVSYFSNGVEIADQTWKGGGIVASYTFLAKDAPKNIPGFGISLGFVCLSALSATLYFLGVTWENRKRQALRDAGKDVGSFVYLR